MTFAKVLWIYIISARYEPKNLNLPVCDWSVQKLLDPVRQSEFIEHLLMKKGARWLIMAYPSYSPSSSSNSPSSSAVASSHEEKRHVFCHVWGDRDPTLGCQSLAFAGWLQNLILSYVNACDCTEWSSCIVMWDKVPLFMITLTYIQLVRVHSHLQTTPLMMQDRTNTSPMYIQCIYLGINSIINALPQVFNGNQPYRPLLILLILGNQIIHVGLGFCEFHLIHTFSCIPVKECFATEHSSKVPFVEVRLGRLSKSWSWRTFKFSICLGGRNKWRGLWTSSQLSNQGDT